MEWIDINERLPDFNQKDGHYRQSDSILLYSEESGVEIGYYAQGKDDDDGLWSDFYTGGVYSDIYPFRPDYPVTHWMPLPNPPDKS